MNAFIAEEQRSHPAKHLLLCSTDERKSYGFGATCVWTLSLTQILWCVLCVCLRHMKAVPHACPLGSGTHPLLPQPLSSFSLHLSLSTQHPHSVVLRVKDGSFWDTFDARFTTVWQTQRSRIQKQRKKNHKNRWITRHALRPICKTHTLDGLSALVECFTHNTLAW